MINQKSIQRGIQLYLASLVIYYSGIIFCQQFPYYQQALRPLTQQVLVYLFLSYVVLAPLAYFIFAKEDSTNKPYLLLKGIVRNLKALVQKQELNLEPEEKVALLFLGVKLFFLPTMLNFLLNNWAIFSAQIFQTGLKPDWFSFSLNLLFTIDTFIFTLGYALESRALGNIVKSVEPTFLGWFVTLLCYPPFNSLVGNYVPWGANDHVLFWNTAVTTVFRIIILLLLVIFVWASVSLGLKASNLTNRGIVAKFPYSFVRHPAYASKCLMWWLTLLPAMNWPFFLGMLFWTLIYYFRAMTEERHLRQDADYVKYCEKVKFRFIPRMI